MQAKGGEEELTTGLQGKLSVGKNAKEETELVLRAILNVEIDRERTEWRGKAIFKESD